MDRSKTATVSPSTATIGTLVDDAGVAIGLTASKGGSSVPTHRLVDLLGRVNEYFLTRFASADGPRRRSHPMIIGTGRKASPESGTESCLGDVREMDRAEDGGGSPPRSTTLQADQREKEASCGSCR
ncbi:MAG: hypothetical protein DWH79_04895 [Planctomycetota bacterium]|nr:MAG: hypothetical protein DWH79_04895 [Planctomycetota bacterium]